MTNFSYLTYRVESEAAINVSTGHIYRVNFREFFVNTGYKRKYCSRGATICDNIL